VSPQERFRELVARYAPAMRRLCAVYARAAADREDLFQNIFLAVWKALPAFRGDASERTWMYSIAHNVALTWKTRDRRWQNGRVGLDEATETAPAASLSAQRRLELYEMISRLVPVDRQLVVLWLEGFTSAEIAAVAGMRPGTVAVRLTRIRQNLAEEFRNSEASNG